MHQNSRKQNYRSNHCGPGSPRLSGFSLLELLVVLVIIGIIIAVAVLTMGNMGENQKIQNAGKQLANRLNLVEEQAILEPTIFGLEINNNGYGFYRIVTIKGKKKWQKIEDSRLLQFQTWPEGTQITIKVSKQSVSPIPGPKIIITASGETTAFKLQLSSDAPQYSIETNGNGAIVQKRF